MNEETKDKRTSEDIDTSSAKITAEEYARLSEERNYYKSEYDWITSRDTNSAVQEVNDEARKLRAMINGERSKEQLHYLACYNTLTIKKYLIETKQYAAILYGEIERITEIMQQFEIDTQEFTRTDILKSWIGMDNRTREAVRMSRLLSRIRRDGLPKKVNLNLQSPEQILTYMKKYGDFVGIEIPDSVEPQTTELAVSEGYLTKAQREYYDFVNKTILGKDETSPRDNAVTVDTNENQEERTDVRSTNEHSAEQTKLTKKHTKDLHATSKSDSKGEINQ